MGRTYSLPEVITKKPDNFHGDGTYGTSPSDGALALYSGEKIESLDGGWVEP